MAAPRTQFYHPAQGIEAAIAGTERAIRRAEGVALVVGPPGTGKSLLLWQAILAEIGEPYRGIDEAELRIALVERIRGLAATGSGLVVLVDEAQTLPTRLIEELRLLTNVPTPLPAVHIVLAGSTKLEELLGLPRMESLAQRIAVRSYLEPLDHAETVAYLRTQTKTAGCDWDALFAPGCDDAVFTATDGVPRLINQLCDHALVLRGESTMPVTPAAIAAAWRDIQRLPAPTPHAIPGADGGEPCLEFGHGAAHDFDPLVDGTTPPDLDVVEFGGFDDGVAVADHHAPPRNDS
jgi:type II secretory pathway predicted ATPase ExeA